MNIFGQTKLLQTLDSFTLATLPKTILLLGDRGCGKDLVAKYVSERLELPLVQINNDVTDEQLLEYSLCPLNKFYLIDLNSFLEKEQNKLLKFIEEPSATVFIILMARSEIGILPTILNRCVKYHFAQYTEETLRGLSWMIEGDVPDFVFNICKTPGQLLDIKTDTLIAMKDLCEKIITYISTASYANTLSIAYKINYKEEYNKFDFETFYNVFLYVTADKYIKENSKTAEIIYNQLVKYHANLLVNRLINKESFMLNLLTSIYEATR